MISIQRRSHPGSIEKQAATANMTSSSLASTVILNGCSFAMVGMGHHCRAYEADHTERRSGTQHAREHRTVS